MIIVGVILLLFIPLILAISFKTNEANDQISELQAQLLAIRLSSLSNSIGNLGPGSSIIADVYVPPTLKSIKLKSYKHGSELILNITSGSGSKEVVELIKFPAEEFSLDNLEKGMARFEISWSEDKKILVSRKY